MRYPEVQNYIDGQLISNGSPRSEVYSPLNGEVISTVPLSGSHELNDAVASAKKAYPAWSALTIKDRVQIFFKYRQLMVDNIDRLTEAVHIENGKTMSEARGEVEKSIELTEFTCSLPQLVSGEILEVSKGVECRTEYCPMGIVASISPFNFPHMVPHWSVPNALALGNCVILKPSEKVPISANIMAEMLTEAGLPKGVFNVVNGGKETVEQICDHPDIKGVSFVGSTKIAAVVYKRATSNLKRCVALGGAKNHLIVLPDAHPQMTANNVVASMSGCAGQRCMAAAAMVGVGNIDHIVEQMIIEGKKLIPGDSLGPVISREAQQRIEQYIDEAEKAGAKILLDGRNTRVDGNEDGFYVGATIIDNVTPDMAIAKEEVFGPVIAIIRAKTIDEGIAIENSSNYGNAAAVFTQSGGSARYVIEKASAGMIGVNIGVPVPREPFSFGGWNESKFGVSDITGKSSIEFWTRLKKTTSKWNAEAKVNWMS